MFAYWSTFVEPVLKIVKPSVIVEIGSEGGWNTEKILEFCRDTGGGCHVIDPQPVGRTDELAELLSRWAVCHQDLSLNVLPNLSDGDLFLIDGDHNWYTVYHELGAIVKTCRAQGRRPPVMILHDVFWPNGRRDMYYDPATIPENYRHPHERKGMCQGQSELTGQGGLNYIYHNALFEGGPRNGVMTAIEDFLAEHGDLYSLMTVPGFNGLGLLCPNEGLDPAVRRELETVFAIPDRVRILLSDLESSRLDALIRLAECEKARKALQR